MPTKTSTINVTFNYIYVQNKTMFAYAKALVELGYFDAININFLIVGHTHTRIDQYFRVLSKAIKSAEFIGSPISLQALCSHAHKDRARPSVNRQLDVCYNIVDALKPYINKKIKFSKFLIASAFAAAETNALCFTSSFLLMTNGYQLSLISRLRYQTTRHLYQLSIILRGYSKLLEKNRIT
jgi:hypothetical protein